MTSANLFEKMVLIDAEPALPVGLVRHAASRWKGEASPPPARLNGAGKTGIGDIRPPA